MVVFNLLEMVENLCKYGGSVFGICFGKNMVDYLDYVLMCFMVVGSFYLIVVCLIFEFLILCLSVLLDMWCFNRYCILRYLSSSSTIRWCSSFICFSSRRRISFLSRRS